MRIGPINAASGRIAAFKINGCLTYDREGALMTTLQARKNGYAVNTLLTSH